MFDPNSSLIIILLLVLALAFGVLVNNRRFFKSNKPKSFSYQPKFSKTEEKKTIEERIKFRVKKNTEQPKPGEFISFKEAYKNATNRAHHKGNVSLNKTFWIILGILITLVLCIFEFDFSIFTA